MRHFKNLKLGDKSVLNTINNNDNSCSGDYPESVVLESPAKPSLRLPKMAQDNGNLS